MDNTTNALPWYKSQIIWVQIVSVIFALGARFAWWPKELQQADVIAVIMVVISIITGGIRATSSVQPVTVTQKAADNKNAPAPSPSADI